MRSVSVFISLLFIQVFVHAKTIVLQPNIEKVTVFSIGAEVTHNLALDLPAGQNAIKLMNVSPFALSNSVLIGDEDLTVINATLVKKLTTEEIIAYNDQKESFQKQITALNNSLENASKNGTASNLQALLEYYDFKVLELKKKIRSVESLLKKDEDNNGDAYLEVLVSSSKSLKKNITLKYVNGSAAWVPEYEIYVSDITQDLKLKYIAKIMNRTGEDWDNVEIQLSLNSPFDKTGIIPKITPVNIWGIPIGNYNEQANNEFDTSFNDDQLKIEGIEYETYNAPSSTQLLKVEGKKSVPANGGIYKYDVFNKALPTNYIWYAFPGLEESTYLIGQITNWADLSIADGNATIYYNGINIGDSYISIAGLPDTLDIPIGQNKEVIVERKIIASETFTKETNSKKKETVSFSYTIKTNRKEDVQVRIFDQIPVSQNNKTKVDLIEKSNAIHIQETGEITWNYTINNATTLKKNKLIYTFEFDKSRSSNSFYSQSYGYFQKKSVRKVRAKF